MTCRSPTGGRRSRKACARYHPGERRLSFLELVEFLCVLRCCLFDGWWKTPAGAAHVFTVAVEARRRFSSAWELLLGFPQVVDLSTSIFLPFNCPTVTAGRGHLIGLLSLCQDIRTNPFIDQRASHTATVCGNMPLF